MNFWEALVLVGTAATILGVFLAIYGVVNNKTLKHETKLTRETLAKTMAEESRLTREMIKETIEYLAKYLGDLIVAEGERTRLAISK
ncbi:MAG: hypothetical protein AB1567_06165 [bacterium]